MEEVRQLVQEEGREARNLVAFHVAVDTPAVRVARRPGRGGAARAAARLRSASAGRDKRSELRARYWALLFGDLQRAIGEIYNTVEAHENLNECQEVILVLENYTRDFKALGEWFRLKWEYDNTPPPQRPQSLAWEIRKTDFVRPESRRTYSVKSSPSVSGKNSPCLSGHNTPSGKNSPNLTGKASPGSGKISPRITSGHSSTSPKGNIEFFNTKKSSKIITPPEPKFAKEIPRLYEIKEREKEITEETDELPNKTEAGPINTKVTPTRKELKDEEFRKEKIGNQVTVEIGKAKECSNTCPKQVIIKTPKRIPKTNDSRMTTQLSSPVKATISKLDAMESEFLGKHLIENEAKNENLLNEDKEIIHVSKTEKNKEHKEKPVDNDKENITTESPVKSDDNFADVSSESSNKSNDENQVGHSEYKPIENKINNDVVPKAMEIDDNTSVKNHFEKYTDGELLENANITIEVKNAKETAKYSSADIKDQSLELKDEKKEQEEQKKAELKTDLKSNARPAYSQAAAKPKPVSAKTEVKAPSRLTALTRSKTVVEIRPSSVTRAPKKNLSSKCSYPFNLTTGRTSLFDGPANKGTVKKTVNRIQTASGDTKTTPNKLDIKKRPPRPSSLKINEKGINSDKNSSTLGKIKDYDEYSSSDTIVTQINMSRIESSESLKTLVPEEQTIQDVANSLELLNIDGDKNDNEGWLTVKSRRLSRESKKHWKSHWANRFHQPSATTSLPTLNMIESPKQDAKSILSEPNTDRAQSEQPQNKPEKAVKVTVEPKVEKLKDPAMIRQKSDVTGLKTRSSRNRAMKKEKVKDTPKEDGELTKNRLHSSLESLTTGLARSQESTEEVFDFDKWKTEFKTTLRYMEDDDPLSDQHEILNTADPNEMSEIVAMTSQIEENEKKISWALDFQSDVDQRKLCEEEDLLNRQIMELQQVSDIDLDTETDDTETDAEILCDTRTSGQSSESLGSLAVSLEDQYETALAGMSWAERVDTLGLLEALVARDPGRAQQLHAKLSQGIKRRGSFQDALRRLQAKQARAERQRLEYQTERARKIHQLLARVEEVKIAKNQLIEAKRLRMERRLQRAAENRHQHIKDIVRKAHDEEEKLREIAFIKQLEAQNRRHDFLAHCRSHTTRLRLMRRERLHKLEQKAARDAAVGARREALEEARRERVASLLERRRLRDQRHERLRELRRRQRGDAAREKAEGVKSRLSALAAAAEMETLALQSRIRHKQDASQQRLDAHLQAIREKATGPRQQTTSESHDQSSKEEKELAEEAERLEQERKEREKQKAIKKRARKVKQKLLATSTDISSAVDNIPSSEIYIYPASNRMYKVLQQLNSIITPLLDPENEKRHDSTRNGFETDEPVGKKNKKGKNNIFNGDKTGNNHGRDIIEVKIDKPRNKKSMNKTSNEDNMNNNSNENKNAHNITNNVKSKSKTIDTTNTVLDAKLETIEIIEIDLNNKEIELKNDGAKTNEEEAKDSKQEVKTENSKRRKKKKDQEEKPKLSKASSVCSSLSDMSKTSVKEKRAKETIDVAFIERQLNELHRTMERFDRSIPDKLTFSKVNGLRTLGLLLGVAADREDLAPHFTARSLTTAVMVVCRAVGASEAAAVHFITSNICVHVIKLLSNQLEKDLQSDPREMDLARQLCDCLSIALDSVLCQTRLYAEKCERRETSDACGENLAPLRSRCHTLISYICLCGCITRAEKAGEARESVQTLLTICVDLCQPCCVDVGGERVSATQSLRCALGRGVCGSRAEFCMLFAAGAELAPSGAFVRAARTAHLLRSLADLDHNTVQEAFGEGGWPLEFRAAVARLLSQHAPNEKEAPRTSVLGLTGRRLDHTLSETMVLDLIVLVGFVVVNNPQLQETICDGWSVIKMLCTLPANWLVSRPHCHALLPTLVALSEHTETAAAIAAELSTGMLEEYMESPEAQKVKLVQVIKQGKAKKAGQKAVRLG